MSAQAGIKTVPAAINIPFSYNFAINVYQKTFRFVINTNIFTDFYENYIIIKYLKYL